MNISPAQNATLNEARLVLKELDKAASDDAIRLMVHEPGSSDVNGADPMDFGRLCEACNMAEDALYNALSTAKHHCKLEVDLRI